MSLSQGWKTIQPLSSTGLPRTGRKTNSTTVASPGSGASARARTRIMARCFRAVVAACRQRSPAKAKPRVTSVTPWASLIHGSPSQRTPALFSPVRVST